MQQFWFRYPFLRLLISLVSGILIGSATNFECQVSVPIFLGISLPILLLVFLKRTKISETMNGALIVLFFLFLGFGLQTTKTNKLLQQHQQMVQERFLAVNLLDQLAQRPTYCKWQAQMICTENPHGSAEKLIVMAPNDSIKPLLAGQQFLIKSQWLEPIAGPKNPDEFDYKAYLFRRGVHSQLNLSKHPGILMGSEEISWIQKLASTVQKKVQQTLQKYVQDTLAVGIAQALLYGDGSGIDRESSTTFAHTGTLHVLAVSGMHVGLIYYVLQLCFFFLEKNKQLQIIKSLLLLLLIWFYTLICGLSPSIVRASVMFSFMLIGSLLRRQGSAINSLTASAFVMLFFDPFLLSDKGFLLSYAAVGGLTLFYNPIYEKFTSKWWAVQEGWKMTSASIGATAGTVPLSFLFFHQFPLLFLLSNLVIIPLSTVCIYLGILLAILSSFSWLVFKLGLLLKWLILGMVYVATFIEHIPFSYVDGIQSDWLLACFQYGLIWYLFRFLVLKKIFDLKYILSLLLVISFCQLLFELKRDDHWTFYSLRKGQAISYSYQGNAFCLSDPVALTSGSFERSVKPHLTLMNSFQTDTCIHSTQSTFIDLAGQRILIMPLKKGRVVLLLNQNKSEDTPALICSGLTTQSYQALLQILKRYRMNCLNLDESGAFSYHCK